MSRARFLAVLLLVPALAQAACFRGLCRGPLALRPLLKDAEPGQLYTATDCLDAKCSANGGTRTCVFQDTGSAWALILCAPQPTTTTTSAPTTTTAVTTTTGGGTTTTTLPGCDTAGALGCHSELCDNGACEPHLPGTSLACFDLSSCDGPLDPACTSDADCTGGDAGKRCFDLSDFGGPGATACCFACGEPTAPCNAIEYCRCNDDSFITCTSDGDCLPGMVCRVVDASPTNFHCYHPTCTDSGGCADETAGCAAVCGGLGGTFGLFCMQQTCVGGTNDGQPCDTRQESAMCPSGTCTGTPVCNCTTTTTTLP